MLKRDGGYYDKVMEDHSSFRGDSSSIKEIIPFTGEDDIDVILNKDYSKIGKSHQLVRMWGCSRCFMRGTDLCPYGILDGKLHVNGFCHEAITLRLVEYKSMKTPDGIRHIRNINILNTKHMLDKYVWKLNTLSSSNKVTRSEMYLLKNVSRLHTELNDMVDKAIKQDEGLRMVSEHKFTPSDLNMLLKRANSDEIEVEGEVIE